MLISIIGILFIPIMYSGVLIWANWDPYDQLDTMPVAVVNNDAGAELDGEKLQLGNELIDKLKESNEFDFQFVDKKEGYQNLKENKAYLLVEIPKNFSENATTLMDDEPKKLQLKYVTNEGYNFLSAQISESAIKEIKMSLSEKVTETYAETMFEMMTKMADGFQSADEAAGKLQKGITELDSGAKTIEEKLGLLAEKQLILQMEQQKCRMEPLSCKKVLLSLASGLSQLSNAQNELIEGAKKVEDGGEELTSGIQEAQNGLGTVEEKMNEVIAGTEKIHEGSTQLSDSLQKLEAGANSGADGAAELKTGIINLQSELEPLLAGLPSEKQEALKQALQSFLQVPSSLKLEVKSLQILQVKSKQEQQIFLRKSRH